MLISRREWQAALVVTLGLAATWTTTEAADPKYLPNDTEIVLTVNVKQILDSELVKANKDAVDQGKAMLENQAGDNPAMKYLKAAGFDIFRDLHSVTVASSGAKEPSAIIVTGKFDSAKITATAEEAAKDNPDSLKVTKLAQQTVFEITPRARNWSSPP